MLYGDAVALGHHGLERSLAGLVHRLRRVDANLISLNLISLTHFRHRLAPPPHSRSLRLHHLRCLHRLALCLSPQTHHVLFPGHP